MTEDEKTFAFQAAVNTAASRAMSGHENPHNAGLEVARAAIEIAKVLDKGE